MEEQIVVVFEVVVAEIKVITTGVVVAGLVVALLSSVKFVIVGIMMQAFIIIV